MGAASARDRPPRVKVLRRFIVVLRCGAVVVVLSGAAWRRRGSGLALVLLPGADRGDRRAVVRSVVGEPVEAEVVVAGLVLGLGREVGVADGGGVDVPGPVALVRVTDPGGEADLAQGAGDTGAGGGRHACDVDVDDAAAVVGSGGRRVSAR